MLKRSIVPGKMTRLAEVCAVTEPAVVEMTLTTDASRRHWLSGSITAVLATDCQRCLEPVTSTLSTTFKLWLLEEKAEPRLKASNLEALQNNDVRLIADGMVNIVQLVEDELLLALPEQPCQDEQCPQMPPLSFPATSPAGLDAGHRTEVAEAPGNSAGADSDSSHKAGQRESAAPATPTRRPFAGLREMMQETDGADASPASDKSGD